jgi:ubiquinone/menaquinone biosynthesis C-methylase UbiE
MQRNVRTLVCLLLTALGAAAEDAAKPPSLQTGVILADKAVDKTLTPLVAEYNRLSNTNLKLTFLSSGDLAARLVRKDPHAVIAVAIAARPDAKPPAGGKTVAWTPKKGLPIHAIALSKHPDAAEFVHFSGGHEGHQFWSWDGYRIGPGKNPAEVHDWISEHRVKRTYPLTAMRMMREIGGIRDGVCIDIGCGSGQLELELAKRSNFKITGLDINRDAKGLYEKRIKAAGLEKRCNFVVGDAQKMPFADNSADVIVSRGTLTFIPDIGKCLREVQRVLKPTGVAILGGRYLYTPKKDRITNEKLKAIVAKCGVPGAKVITDRGQWVKIVGAKAPKAAHTFQGGPHMLPNRFIADYRIRSGMCLQICGSDGPREQALQRGFLERTDVEIVALYPNEKTAAAAEKRIRAAKQDNRIYCAIGTIKQLRLKDNTFDLIVGTGPMLIFEKNRVAIMKELHRILKPGGVGLVGGRFLYMPKWRKVPSATLRAEAARTGIPSIRISDDRGQWVEIRKGVRPPDAKDKKS